MQKNCNTYVTGGDGMAGSKVVDIIGGMHY